MAKVPFKTVIKRIARFDVPGVSAEAMISIGNACIKSIQGRMLRAQDVYDQASPPLSTKYGEWKSRKYGSGVRDLYATGRTHRGMKVIQAGQNYCIVGFSDAEALRRVKENNRLSRQWGISDANRRDIHKAAADVFERPVVVVQREVA